MRSDRAEKFSRSENRMVRKRLWPPSWVFSSVASSSLTVGAMATKEPNSSMRPPIQIQATSGRTITRNVPRLVSGLTLLMMT